MPQAAFPGMKDVIQQLQAYLMRSLSFDECRDWLASVDWNDPALTKEDWEILGELQLVLTEIGEGMREEPEFRETASRVVAERTDTIGSGAPLMAASSEQ